MKNKLLAIYVYKEAYYEDTIELEVIDKEQEEKYIKNGYTICSNSEEYANVLLDNIDNIQRNLDIILSVSDFKDIKNASFYDLIENYSYLQDLKKMAYDFDNGKNNYVKNYRQYIYSDKDGYGVFRQELVVFNDFLLITRFSSEFKNYVDKKLLKNFKYLVSNDKVEHEIKRLNAKIELLERNIKSRENDIKLAKENIKTMNKDIKQAKEDLSKLVDNKEELKWQKMKNYCY